MILLDECIEALGEGARVLYDNDRVQILSNLDKSFPFSDYS